MKLRRFNEAGIERFRDTLKELREGRSSDIDVSILGNDELSLEISGGPILDRNLIETKREAADLLQNAIGPLNIPELMNDVGLWSWLGCFFFDSICPAQTGSNGR